MEEGMELRRHGGNPIIEPRGDDWEAVATFNCAALYEDGRIHLLYRAVGDYVRYASRQGYAMFDKDLALLERREAPVFSPEFKLWETTVEDARLIKLGGTIYVTYVITHTPSPPGAVRRRLGIPKPNMSFSRTAMAKVEGLGEPDGPRFRRLGIITPYQADDKDVVLFPEKVQGKYAVIHRPANWVGPGYPVERPSIWFAFLDGLPGRMYGHKLIMQPEEDWEAKKIGAGPPPIKTEKGWLLIYHGVDWGHVYRAGAVLLDLEEPWRIIARTRDPILEPKEPYEVEGDVPNVVFPEGAVVIGDELLVFYGGADKVCCLAKAGLDELLSYLLD
jgi:predicted GH43/DUF377 family glycosyl hydrolase